MRSILEKAIVALLNEEHEQAEALFHRFMVERARQIHESLRQGEESPEDFGDEITENYFTEDDLTDLVSDSGEDDAVEGDDAVDADVDADASVDDEGADLDADLPAETDTTAEGDFDTDASAEGDVETRLDDLEDQLDRLMSEFESAMAEMNGGESDEDFSNEDETTNDFDDAGDVSTFGDDSDVDADASAEAEDEVTESEDEDCDDEFDDISESIVSELEKISVTLTDGKEVGDGKSFSQNKGNALPSKKADANDAKPFALKAEEHTGFERETAPSVKSLPKRKNTRSSFTDGNKSVSKQGDGSATLNKDFAGKKQG
jgi:hypothetical protein